MINGKMLLAVRNTRNWTQEKLHEESGVGVQTIIRIENADGPYNCDSATIERLASGLGLSIEDLSEDIFGMVVTIGDNIRVLLDGRPVNIDALKKSFEDFVAHIQKRDKLLGKIYKSYPDVDPDEIPEIAIAGPFQRIRFSVEIDHS